ncbi:biotin transporter BioY [Bosea sp. TND4EK4]|uniref:biotin transporter BioY n=1 Tax=Bosea sp. TND4EK4 TaxID=1907408 RepID=UPI00095618DD|nr:biotin transporter BioY [Bosea sp. TND4EK4]SIQ83114.1 biotin transport system substrate-specific component [Bosea sp. TND4EK4]
MRDIVLIALFAAITAGLAMSPPIVLPAIGVPVTAQSLGAMLAGGVLGARRGALSMVLFLALVAMGLPLLSGGRGGIGVFLGPTAGYLFGWIFAAFVVGFLVELFWNGLTTLKATLICAIGGVVVLYAIGIPWSAAVAGISVPNAFFGSLPFLIGDILKCYVAGLVVVIVKRSYPIIIPTARA